MLDAALDQLRSRLAGDLLTDPGALQERSSNYGRINTKSPGPVICPKTATDVAETIQFAREHGIPVTTRGAAHSQDQHALSDGGLMLDLRSLTPEIQINAEEEWAEVSAGITWRELVDACAPYQLIPPVLTNNLNVTIGGTCSIAGLGTSSFRYGTQADQCLAIEVVIGTGEVLRCSPEQNQELFDHVLCGLGQFGVLTKVRLRLRRHKPMVRTYYLLYDNLEQLMADSVTMMESDRIDYIECWATPCNQGVRTMASGRKLPFAAWFYPMHLTVEFDSESPPDESQVLAGLTPYRHVHTEDYPMIEYALRLETVFELWKAMGYWENAHPWMEAIFPWGMAQPYIERVLSELSPVQLGGGHVLIWPAHRAKSRMPMFRVPDGEWVLGFGILSGVPKQNLGIALPTLAMASDAAMMFGAKRYMSGWLNFDADRWRQHFGDYWPTVCALKRKYDPDLILNPGLIPFGEGQEG